MSSFARYDDSRLMQAFLEEAEELARKLGEQLALTPEGSSRAGIDEIFRIVHSLKSEAATLGFTRLSELAHRMEDVLGVSRAGNLALEGAARDAIIAGADLIVAMLGAIGRGEGDGGVDTRGLIAELSSIVDSSRAAPVLESAPTAFTLSPGQGGPRGAELEVRAERAPEAAAPPGAPTSGEAAFTPFERAQLAEACDRGETLSLLSFSVDDAEAMKFARAYLVFSNLELVVNVVKVDPPMDGEPASEARYGRVKVWFTGSPDEALAAARVDQVRDQRVEPLDPATVLASKPAAAARALAGQAAAPVAASAAAPGVSVAQEASTAPVTAAPILTERSSIRVDTRRLDELWSLVAELVQERARVATLSERLGKGVDPVEVRSALAEAADGLATISAGMQQAMMEARMIPISIIFSKFPRLVRDLSRKLGKSIELELAGGETEIDRGIVEVLSDPLTHLIRNAIDHGIEFPEERVRMAKSEKGKVSIAASQQGGRIVIEISDDGRGIDPEEVRRRAVATGIPGAAAMDERRLLELVFLPGFSTREVVTDLSGRGVGMDVVATRVRSTLKGEVLLDTRPGRGTRVTLLLPLTLTIMPVLLVRSEEHFFGLPLAGVDATVRLLNTEIRGSGRRQYCAFQDAELPLHWLSGMLGRPSRRAEELDAVIVRHGQNRGCLVVDELLEERELVIKPLDDLANHGRLFSGVSVREDGALVFILDTSFARGGDFREAVWAPPS